ncbi:hypothetical protein FIBSPDRAFT_667133, partial [Athelia psychrophila]
SNATHLLQGLDIVVFATVKHYITEERDLWEFKTGEKLSKTKILSIYRCAHLRALTPQTVWSAFQAT